MPTTTFTFNFDGTGPGGSDPAWSLNGGSSSSHVDSGAGADGAGGFLTVPDSLSTSTLVQSGAGYSWEDLGVPSGQSVTAASVTLALRQRIDAGFTGGATALVRFALDALNPAAPASTDASNYRRLYYTPGTPWATVTAGAWATPASPGFQSALAPWLLTSADRFLLRLGGIALLYGDGSATGHLDVDSLSLTMSYGASGGGTGGGGTGGGTGGSVAGPATRRAVC